MGKIANIKGHRRWLFLFAAVSCLLAAQVIWWTTIFMKDVVVIAELKRENVRLHRLVGKTSATIQEQGSTLR